MSYSIPLKYQGLEQADRIEAMLIELMARTEPKVKKTRQERVLEDDPAFTAFWKLYPLKKGKLAARKAWEKKKTGADFILKDVACRIKNDRQWIDGFMPHASTYLNGCRWEDQIVRPKAQVMVPRDDDAMYVFAIERGMREPHVGESWYEYRRYVEDKVQS